MLPVVQYIEGKAGFHQGGQSSRTKKSVVDVKEVTMQKLFCLQTHSEKDVLSQPLSSSFNFQFTIIIITIPRNVSVKSSCGKIAQSKVWDLYKGATVANLGR